MKRKLDSYQRIIILSAIDIAIIIVLVYFVFLPSHNNIQNKALSISEERIALADKKSKGYTNKNLEMNIEQIQENKPLLDRIFLKQDEEIALIDDMENFAKDNFIDISVDLAQNKKTDKANYYILPLVLSGKGKYSNIMNFIKDIEQTSYYISFDSIEISKGDSITSNEIGLSANDQDLGFVIKTKTYWKK